MLTKPTRSQLMKALNVARRSDKVDGARLRKAFGIAQRKSTHFDGHALVVIGTKGETYRANGTCQCPDHTFRGTVWCKHRLALALWMKAARV
jgi:predicted nucleic acid-binding Zn finger protein